MLRRPGPFLEPAGGLDHHVHPQVTPGERGRILLGQHPELVVAHHQRAVPQAGDPHELGLRGIALLADSLPEKLPTDGVGPLTHHRYWADIEGSRLDADVAGSGVTGDLLAHSIDTAIWLIGLLAPLVLIFLAFWVIYKVVPNRPVGWGEVMPGAIVAALLWTVLRFGFTWYATSVANYESAFGPISTGVTLLVFLYFASVIVLLGAEFARASALDDELGPITAADPRLLPVPVEPPPGPAAPPKRGPAANACCRKPFARSRRRSPTRNLNRSGVSCCSARMRSSARLRHSGTIRGEGAPARLSLRRPRVTGAVADLGESGDGAVG